MLEFESWSYVKRLTIFYRDFCCTLIESKDISIHLHKWDPWTAYKFVWISLNVSPGIRRYVFQPLSFRIILQKYTWLYFCICFKKNIFLTWHALAQIQASKTLGYSKCCKICAYLMHFKSFCKIDNPNA